MASISLKDVSVHFPVYNATTRSLKNRMLQIATGGSISQGKDGHVVIAGLQGLTVDFKEGERIGLLGHNGAGKTTLLRVLSRIYKPTEGHARISGRITSLINISLGIDPEATGVENIRLRAALMGLSKDKIAGQYDEIAEFAGLGNFLSMPYRTYSTGMQLRLAFAISTAIEPEILIMDEWLATGDEDFKVKADQRLRQVVSNTKILVLASHSRVLLERNCDRIIWLEHGRVKMDGPVDEVCRAYFG